MFQRTLVKISVAIKTNTYLHISIKLFQLLLKENTSHPCLLVIAIIEAQLLSCLPIETARLISLSNKKWLKLLWAIRICCKGNSDTILYIKRKRYFSQKLAFAENLHHQPPLPKATLPTATAANSRCRQQPLLPSANSRAANSCRQQTAVPLTVMPPAAAVANSRRRQQTAALLTASH